jgi:hypothetical protein
VRPLRRRRRRADRWVVASSSVRNRRNGENGNEGLGQPQEEQQGTAHGVRTVLWMRCTLCPSCACLAVCARKWLAVERGCVQFATERPWGGTHSKQGTGNEACRCFTERNRVFTTRLVCPWHCEQGGPL